MSDLSSTFIHSLTQGEPPRFASLSRLLADPNDRADIRCAKAMTQLTRIIGQFDRRAEEIQAALKEWAAVHLDGAPAEIQGWTGGTFAMLDRRRGLLEQIGKLIDALDESFDEEAVRQDMVRQLVDLAEREAATAATISDRLSQTVRSKPCANLTPTLGVSASPPNANR
jgi:hypothetical protein